MKRNLGRKLLSILLSVTMIVSIMTVGVASTTVYAGVADTDDDLILVHSSDEYTETVSVKSRTVGGVKKFAIDKMVDIGMRIACEGMVTISEACEENGNGAVSKVTALVAEWGLMSAEEAATTKNIELCEEILSEINNLTEITEKGISSIETAIANLQVDFSTDSLTNRQDIDINQVISDINMTGGVLDFYEEYVEVASKHSDGSASDDEMLEAQYNFLLALRSYAEITTAITGNTTEEKLESVSKQIFGDTDKADVVNQNIESIVGTLSENLIVEPGTHSENVMSEAMTLAYNYYPFSHQQYSFVTNQVGLQINTIVEILTMYNEILALQYGYLTQTQSLTDDQLSSLLTTYDTHVKNLNNTLIPGIMLNIDTMLSTEYMVGAGVRMTIDDYMKPEDAVVTNLKVEGYVSNYYANKVWGEYHTYHKLMTTTSDNTHNVYYLLNDTRGLADLYDYSYSNPEHGVSYDNITSDINDGCNTFSLPTANSSSVDYKNLFNTNAFSLGGNIIRNYFYDFDSTGASYPLISKNKPLYILTEYYTEKHGHVDKTYVVDVDATQSSASSIKTYGFTPSEDATNRDYSSYFTAIFSPTDTYKQRITAKASNISGVDIQIVTKDSANQQITISNGNSAVVPSGNMLTIKIKVPENVGGVSLTCTRDHDAYNESADPTTELFDETLLNYLEVENGYYIFEYPMPYSQCTFELNVANNINTDENGNFIIKTYEDLCQMANLVNMGIEKYTKGSYILANDIECSGKEWTNPIGQTALYYSNDPAKDGDWGFEGVFDGNGHVIKNLSVKGSSLNALSFGVFGTVSGTVKNLGIENFTYKGAGQDSRVGAVAGQILNGGKIVDCYLVNGNINTYALPRSGVVGGIAGANYSGTIENCYVYNFTAFAGRMGGIAGDNHGDGNNADGTDRPGTIKNCYTSTGSICERGTASDSVANVPAEKYASGEIAYLLNSGVTDGTQAWYQNIDNGLTPDSYPVLISNNTNTVYKVDLTDKTYSNTVPNPIPTFDTDENGNYIIKTYEDLCNMAIMVNSQKEEYVNGSYILANDIDCLGNVWTPIGTDTVKFNGTFDGQGYTISNLNKDSGLDDGNRHGLFVSLNENAVVKNLTVSNADVFPSESPVIGAGVIAKQNNGTISSCIVKNSNVQLGNWSYLGGISGLNNGTIENCAVINTSITRRWGGSSSKTMGGITEVNKGTVRNCYTYNCSYNNGTDLNGAVISSGEAPVNCYFYTTSSVNKTYGTEKSKSQFACGEVAYLLNNTVTDGTQVWYQNIDNGKPLNICPQLTDNGENTVYALANDKGYSNYQYSDGTSVLQRVDLRTYQRFIDENGRITDKSQFVYGFGLVDNSTKTITLYVSDKAERIGILMNQGKDGKAGVITLQGDYPKFDKTSAEILASDEEEPNIYTDGNGCIFITVPKDGTEIPTLTVSYTQKPTSEYNPTLYTLNVQVVDTSEFAVLNSKTGATSTYRLNESDPDYNVTDSLSVPSDDNISTDNPSAPSDNDTSTDNSNESTLPTGDMTNIIPVFIIMISSLMVVFTFIYKRKKS